jgi:hypothetical protein
VDGARKQAQRVVADGMAKAVVDGFEMIEIEQRPATPCALAERPRGPPLP